MILSVVTAVRNEVDTIVSTMESLSQQVGTAASIQHIVVDGASTDGTSEVVSKYMAERTSGNGLSYAYIRGLDHGIYDAMNKGLAKAIGDFVMFLNAGDVFHENCVLGRVVQCIKRLGDPDGVYFGQVLIKSDWAQWKRPSHIDQAAAWSLTNPRDVPHHQTIFYPRSFYSQEMYDLDLIKYGDTDYSLRAVENRNLYGMPFVIADVTLGGFSTRRHTWRQAMAMSEDFARLAHRHPCYYGKADIVRSRLSFATKWLLDSVFGSKAKHLAMRIARRRK